MHDNDDSELKEAAPNAAVDAAAVDQAGVGGGAGATTDALQTANGAHNGRGDAMHRPAGTTDSPDLRATHGVHPTVNPQHSSSLAEHPAEPLSGAPEALKKAEPADGIEILVKLAESGEIDPKNVDIIDVTDKFLKAIAAAPKENLRQSGKILFHACVLLRMKAEALLTFASADLDSGDDFLDFDEGGQIIYDSNRQAVGRQITLHDLERALVRKANTRQNRQRRVTLDQLIEALREAERIEKVRQERQPRAPRIELAGQHEVNDVDDILDLAHDEDIESTIDRIDAILQNFLKTGEMIQLLQVVRLLDRHGDWVDAFLALLFLSNAGRITLEQEHFWGPLYIVRCDDEQPQQARLAGA